MSASSNDTPRGSGRGSAANEAAAGLAIPVGAPHGYDPVEFGPGESRRDFPSRRERAADEERRQLKDAQAAFEGPDKRHDLDDGPAVDAADPEPEAEKDMQRPSRLYRD